MHLSLSAPVDASQLGIGRPLVLDIAVVGLVYRAPYSLRQLLVGRSDLYSTTPAVETHDPLQGIHCVGFATLITDEIHDFVLMIQHKPACKSKNSSRNTIAQLSARGAARALALRATFARGQLILCVPSPRDVHSPALSAGAVVSRRLLIDVGVYKRLDIASDVNWNSVAQRSSPLSQRTNEV